MRRKPVRQYSITEAVASARKDAGLSQRELSARLHEVINYMQRIESGQRDVSVAEFVRIAYAIGIDPCDLLRVAIR